MNEETKKETIIVCPGSFLFIILLLGCSFAIILFAAVIKLGSFYHSMARILLQF